MDLHSSRKCKCNLDDFSTNVLAQLGVHVHEEEYVGLMYEMSIKERAATYILKYIS